MPPRVHVIVVHHRGRAMLERCLETLLASRGVEVEAVVVANGCAAEEIPAMLAGSPRLHRLDLDPPRGFAEANNAGVAWARRRLGEPDAYYFLNNDTESEPDALATLVAALAADPAVGVVGPQQRILGARDHLGSLGIQLTADAWGWDEGIGRRAAEVEIPTAPVPRVAVTGAALLIDAALLAALGGWPELYDYYFEDVDLCLSAQEAGRRVLMVPAAVVHHQISATMSDGSERKRFYFQRNRLLLALAHWPWGLLLAVFRRAVVTEILGTRWKDNGHLRRALYQALRRAPRALRRRGRAGRDRSWTRFLRPPGSVPVITLPELPPPVVTVAAAGGTAPTPSPARRVDSASRDPRPMSRLLVLGAAPLPFEPLRRQYAANLRTWHLVEPLLADGHAVRLIGCRLPETCPPDLPPVVRREEGGLDYLSVGAELFHDDAFLVEQRDAFAPDAVVGVNTHPAWRATAIAGDLPLWCDLNGWVMAEAQTKARIYDDDRYLSHFWRMEREVVERADVISTVSAAQAHATVGELAARGRLNRRSFGHPFVHVIPNAVNEVELEVPAGRVRGALVGDDAFVVLWVGGYNTWTDVDLLFGGLEAAMEARPELHFVSTGGAIEGHDERTFARFRAAVAASRHRERYCFVGWVPTADVPGYYAESDLGLNVDSDNYETVYGARNRLNEMMKAGLPVLTTLGTEISRWLAERDLGLTCPLGDVAAFAERLIWAAGHRDELRERASRAREQAVEAFSYARTTEPLRAWARAPRRAPDGGERAVFADLDFFRGDPQQREAELSRSLAACEARATDYARQLTSIHRSRMWRLWMVYLRLRRLLVGPAAGVVLALGALVAGAGCTAPGDRPRGEIVLRFVDDDPDDFFDGSTLVERRAVEGWDLSGTEAKGDGPWRLDPESGPATFDGAGLRVPGKSRGSLILAAEVDPLEVHALRFDLSATGSGRLEVCWAREGEQLAPGRCVSARTKNGLLDYELGLVTHPEWSGRVDRLRVGVESWGRTPLALRRLVAERLDVEAGALAGALARSWKVTFEDGDYRDTRTALLAPPGLPISRSLTVPPAARLRLALAVEPGVVAPIRFRVVARRQDTGAEEVTFERTVGQGDAEARGRWLDAEVDLGALAGAAVDLRLETDAPEPPSLVRGFPLWAHPEVVAETAGSLPPNLVLISVDTLRADHLSLYGYGRETSPAIDRWAARCGTTFETVVASAPWTIPAHASMLSGLDALSHGVNEERRVPGSLLLLAERLRAAGYSTAAVTGGGYLSAAYGFSQGFDRYRAWRRLADSATEPEVGVDNALRWIEDNAGAPFFLFLHTYGVHTPYAPRQAFTAGSSPAREATAAPRWIGTRLRELRSEDGFRLDLEWIWLEDPRRRREGVPLEPGELHFGADFYDGAVTHVDGEIGRLLAELERLGLARDTLVVLTADHGEGLGDHDHVGHTTLFDSDLLVPWIVAEPGCRDGGRRVAGQARGIDLTPTVLELLGVEPGTTGDGVSLAPLVRGRPVDLPEEAWSYAGLSNRGVALRLGNRLKYVFNDAAWAPIQGQEQVYRLRAGTGAGNRESEETAPEAESVARLRRRVAERLEARAGVRVQLVNRSPERFGGELRCRLGGKPTSVVKSWNAPAKSIARTRSGGIGFQVAPGQAFDLWLYPPEDGLLEVWAGDERVGRLEVGEPGRWRLPLSDGVWLEVSRQGTAVEPDQKNEDPELVRQLRALGYA